MQEKCVSNCIYCCERRDSKGNIICLYEYKTIKNAFCIRNGGPKFQSKTMFKKMIDIDEDDEFEVTEGTPVNRPHTLG